ncbi:hypothetical protein Lfu02_22570 [Longispora fulva]|uniref:Gas vesicle protein n=1 Tax=Longispora fulva TaxID=619741 RepID=A0A8J7KN04_9ACTN|nr:YtxH domain-containing protein [Longispora fulva]MBG6139731.1 gas vesicle protein [Longispora fulva]GIG57885.1 hypothetical protein Lfu02_22570 [Longispora fulva]
MLGLRRKTLSRGEQISNELGECRDHLRGVASLIAGGAAEKLAPRVDQARDLVSPRVERAREAALHGLESATARLGGKPRSRWPMLVGVLGVGVLAGAAAALVMSRRNARWDEYEPVHVLEFDDESPAEKVRTVADNLRDTAGDVRDKAKESLNHVADSVESGAKKLKD